MMIFILAAGDAKRWGGEVKQLQPVRDDTVLGRTIKMLPSKPIILTHNTAFVTPFGEYIRYPENHDTLLNTVMSSEDVWEHHDEVVFLMGDVVWTRKALDKVLEPTDKSYQCYGSPDENFAFRFKSTMYDQVKAHISVILSQGMEGTTWQLYRSICSTPLREHWTEQWFRTLILDKTDDIDYPEDYAKKIETGYFDDKEFDL
jgi:hypothetical protein